MDTTALVALAVLSAIEDGRSAVNDAQSGPGRDDAGVGRLCAACVRRTGVDGGGVAVLSSQGTAVLMHATDEVARTLQDLQFTLGEGPSLDAASSGTPVLVADLTDPANGHGDRWPAFRAEAGDLAARALFAFPIRVADVSLGTLDLYRRAPGELEAEQVTIGLSTGEAVGSTLLASAPRDGVDGLVGADGTYPLSVHRAAGMVMVQLDTTIEEALVRLRATAYLTGTQVTALALDVIEGRHRFTKEDR